LTPTADWFRTFQPGCLDISDDAADHLCCYRSHVADRRLFARVSPARTHWQPCTHWGPGRARVARGMPA
jgi:hypothetical protein